MKKQSIEKNKDGAAPCKHCKQRKKIISYPYVSIIDDLYYAKCPTCNHYDQYEFLGLSYKKTIDNWNRTMLTEQEFAFKSKKV